jgi:putative hydrolase of HD superfamily
MDEDRIEKILEFLKEIDKFKSVYRVTYLTNENRYEDDAGHTWHMCMYALLLNNELKLNLDFEKVMELILVHDLVEVYAGDVCAFDHTRRNGKKEREIEAAEKLFSILPHDLKEKIHNLWNEYEDCSSKEAKFVKSIDKLQALAQNTFTQGRIWKEHNISEEWIRDYNKKGSELQPELKSIFDLLFNKAKDESYFPI